MRSKLLFAAALLCAMATTAVNAQVKQTAKHQHARIRQGVNSGELTKSETRNLVKDQREIHRDVKEAKADGIVTHEERKDIKQDQRQASREIYRKKHNRRDRD